MIRLTLFFLSLCCLADCLHGQSGTYSRGGSGDSITVRFNTSAYALPDYLDLSRKRPYEKYGFWELLEDVGRGIAQIHVNDQLDNIRWDTCVQGNCYNGNGTRLLKIDKIYYAYKGDFQRGKFHGEGAYYLVYKDDLYLIYDGAYLNGKQHGKGKQYDFRAGSSGKLISTTYVTLKKSWYKGDFAYGYRQGTGTSYSAAGRVRYSGAWVKDQANGKGRLFSSAGLIVYEGWFLNGRYDGYGSNFYSNGQVNYKGAWERGVFHGSGSKYFSNGQLECDCVFYYGHPRGKVRLYYKTGGERFSGRIPFGTSSGMGKYTFPGGETFEGKWQYGLSSHKYKSQQVIGKVRDAKGKRVRRIRVFDYHGQHQNYMRSPVLIEVGILSGLMDKHRFTGLERAPWPDRWWKNSSFNVHLWGPRVGRWSRIFPFVFFNTRRYNFPEDNGPFFIPWQYVPEESHTGEQEEVLFAEGEEARAPMVVVNHELGVGAKLHVPLTNESTLHIGGGIVLRQHANLRLDDQPFVRQEVGLRRNKFRDVFNYGGRDVFAEIGFRVSFYTISVRTYYRNAMVSNDRFPVQVNRVTGLGYEAYQIRNAPGRIRPQLNISFFLPLIERKDKGENRKYSRYFPFR